MRSGVGRSQDSVWHIRGSCHQKHLQKWRSETGMGRKIIGRSQNEKLKNHASAIWGHKWEEQVQNLFRRKPALNIFHSSEFHSNSRKRALSPGEIRVLLEEGRASGRNNRYARSAASFCCYYHQQHHWDFQELVFLPYSRTRVQNSCVLRTSQKNIAAKHLTTIFRLASCQMRKWRS